jgi:hypothetical protein
MLSLCPTRTPLLPPQPQRRRVDTNVVSLQLGSLATAVSVATGDAVKCGNDACGALLSSRSKVVDHNNVRVRGGYPTVALECARMGCGRGEREGVCDQPLVREGRGAGTHACVPV